MIRKEVSFTNLDTLEAVICLISVRDGRSEVADFNVVCVNKRLKLVVRVLVRLSLLCPEYVLTKKPDTDGSSDLRKPACLTTIPVRLEASATFYRRHCQLNCHNFFRPPHSLAGHNRSLATAEIVATGLG